MVAIAYTSVVLYHFYAYTWFFRKLRDSKFAASVKNRSRQSFKSDPQFNKESRSSITDLSNSIRRRDDILDITNPLTSDAEYYIVENNFRIESRSQPTRSVVELN
jgi:hypothetical protein